LGDFNLPGVDWTNMSGLVQGCDEIIAETAITQVIDFPTMAQELPQNINDLLFTSSTQHVLSIHKAAPFGNSVHCVLNFQLHIDMNEKSHELKVDVRPKLNYIKGNYRDLNDWLRTYDWSNFYAITDLNEAYSEFCKIIEMATNKYCPLRQKRLRRKHHIPIGMKAKYRRKNRMYKNIRTPSDNIRYKSYASKCEKEVKEFYDNMEEKAVESKDNFYAYIKSNTRNRDDIISIKNDSGLLITDKAEMVEIFANYFSSVYKEPTNSDDFCADTIEEEVQMQDTLDSFSITSDMVLRELLRLPNKETRSSDGIPPIVLKKCAETLVESITHLLKMSLASGVIPDVWRHILVNPIHKKGCKKTVTNYRPIGLTCILCKICERLVRDQLVSHLKSRGFCSDKQHGFARRRSTTTSLLTTQNEWKKLLLTSNELYVVYLDFSKAFDVVDHSILKRKLYEAGLRGTSIMWICDYLRNRKMSVVIDSWESTLKMVHSGVIQGSAMGPALFSFFADDLPSKVDDHTGVGMFADDVKLFSISLPNLEESSGNVVRWSNENALPLAKKKTVFLKIRRRKSPYCPQSINIDGTQIESVTTSRDLGIMIMDDLECSGHLMEIVCKAFKISNIILRMFKTRKIELYKKAFYALVLPILEYASVVWNPIYAKDIAKIETVQRRFTKRVDRKCGSSSESYELRLQRWKIKTLETRRLEIDLSWVYRIIYGYVDMDRDSFFRINQTNEEIKIYPLPLSSRSKNNTQCNTLAYRTYQIWNGLPLDIRNAPSTASFKYKLKKYDLTKLFTSKLIM
jgi:hypothetical protein